MTTRSNYLPMPAFIRLDHAAALVHKAFGTRPYLVGSATERPDYRDVDLRLILDDAEFDALFAERPALWSLICLTVSDFLGTASALPVDFQIQRRTDANAAYPGLRNPVGTGREYAGGMAAALNLEAAP